MYKFKSYHPPSSRSKHFSPMVNEISGGGAACTLLFGGLDTSTLEITSRSNLLNIPYCLTNIIFACKQLTRHLYQELEKHVIHAFDNGFRSMLLKPTYAIKTHFVLYKYSRYIQMEHHWFSSNMQNKINLLHVN